jgi:hypothetical protein
VSAPAVRAPAEFEERLRTYHFERYEEERAVRVGEKEVSEQAAIVERYADLFSRAQLEALRAAEDAASAEERERLVRLRFTCEDGLVDAELTAREDELENALLAVRVSWEGEELPLRAAQARLATLPGYQDRDELGTRALAASVRFNEERRALLAARNELSAELSGQPDAVERNEEIKGISLRDVAAVVGEASVATTDAWNPLRERWLDRLLGTRRDEMPMAFHMAWMRRLSPLADTYTKERSVPVCAASLRAIGFSIEDDPRIRLDLDDRPQKSPRACVIPSDPPAVVHLITRAMGGLHDYSAFLHEAGHALHYAGSDPGLPYTFRAVSRDHALTEIFSFIVEAISREPGWHAEHFGLSDEEAERNAEATLFIESVLFRRYAAKLRFELAFWDRFPEDGGTPAGYSELLTRATGICYPAENFLADMDAGFYSADYLRAWIRSAQLLHRLRADVGDDWWRSPATGELLRELFREGTRPSSEEIAGRLGFDPLDPEPLVAGLSASSS